MYGYTNSEDLAGGRFGLNAKAFVTKFEYNPNAGAGGAQQDAIDFTVQVGERGYRLRYFPISKVYRTNVNGGGEITDTTSQEYKDAIAKETNQLSATLSDIVKCFVDEATLKTALATPISSFKNYAEILQRLVQSAPAWQNTPVDVFLQYQYKPSGDNEKTYLELPKNIKHGLFITKHQGDYKEVRTATSLTYVNDLGDKHTFKRGEWFLGSPYAIQTDLTSGNGGASPTINTGGTGSPTGW